MQQLRAKIGYVAQKAVLFRGSIADNIRFGKKDADAARSSTHAARGRAGGRVHPREAAALR